jgi:hypothetical protein
VCVCICVCTYRHSFDALPVKANIFVRTQNFNNCIEVTVNCDYEYLKNKKYSV